MAEGDHKPPVDRGWAWVILVATFFNTTWTSITYLSGIYNLIFLEAFDQSVALTSWCCSLHASILSLTGPLTSLLIKLIGARLTALTGAALVFLGFLVPSLVPSFTIVFIFYGLLAGTGFGLCYLPFMVWMGFHFKKHRNLAFGIVTTASGFGAFVFSTLLLYLIQEYGWQGSMTLVAGLIAHMLIFAAVLRPINFEIDDTDSDSVSRKHTETDEAGENSGKIHDNHLHSISSKPQVHTNSHCLSQGTVLQVSHAHQDSVKGDHELTSKTTNLQQILPCHVRVNSGKTLSCHNLDKKSPELTLSQPNLYQTTIPVSERNFHFSLTDVNDRLMKQQEHSSEQPVRPILRRNILQHGSSHLKPHHHISSEAITRSMISVNNPWLTYDNDNNCAYSDNIAKVDLSTAKRKCKDFLKEYRSIATRRFILFCANLFVICIGLAIGYLYLPALAKANGSTDFEAAQLISMVGITTVFSRLLAGAATNSKDINTYVVHMGCCGITGIVFFMTPILSPYYIGRACLSVFFGIYGNGFSAMMSPITIDIVGISCLNVAHGAELLMCGVGMLIGPPIGGLVYELLGSFDSVMVLAGVCYFIGALIIMVMPMTSEGSVYL